MEFNVGRIAYGLRKSQEPLPGYTDLVDHDTMIMLLSSDVATADQLPVVARMFAYVWLMNVPPTVLGPAFRDEQRQALADYMGTLVASFVRDLEENGGERALIALSSGDKAKKLHQRAIGSEGNQQCSYCSAPVGPGSVDTDDSAFHPAKGRMAAKRGFQCPVCDRVTVWHEGVNDQGGMTGDTIDGPDVLSKEAGLAWLRAHPGATNDIYI